MFIGLTEEQELLRETMRRLAATTATSGPDDIAVDARLDAQWQRLVEVGVPAFRAPSTCGLEASGVETALSIEELGRGLSALPVLGQAVLTTELLYAAGAEKEVDLVADGAMRMAPVINDELSGFADYDDRGVVLDAAGATHALFAVSDGNRRRLVCGSIDTASNHGGLDLTRSMTPVSACAVGPTETVGDPISAQRWDAVTAMALTAVAADLVGVMAGAFYDAVSYAGERVQFGVRIGSFQAVQHMLADSVVRLEGARSCLWHAAWAVDQLSPAQALLAARTAKAYASAAGRDVVEAAMQVLGGISITWEHRAHLRLRRTLLNRRLFGDESDQYQAIADMRLTDPDLS